MAENTLTQDKFIDHHLQNLTFGQCSDGKWRFADKHVNIGKDHSAHEVQKDYTCNPKDMGFNAIHVDTMAMSLLLGTLFCFFFWRVAKNASTDNVPTGRNLNLSFNY